MAILVCYRPAASRHMPTPIRQKRVAEQIRAELSQLLQRELRDPRLSLVTVTRVMVDRELMHADVYVSTLGDDARQAELMHALDSAQGLLRREIGKRVRLRQTPHLVFHWDPGMENMENVARLLDELKHDDAHQREEGEAGPDRSN
jgi:ribosome-binding factor A